MNKAIVVPAVLALSLSSNSFAMDNNRATQIQYRLNSLPDFYGSVEYVNNTVDRGDDQSSSFDDNGSTIGLRHSHEVSPDVTAYLKIEYDVNADNSSEFFENEDLAPGDTDTTFARLDEAYIGFRGDFGSIQFGTDENVADDFDLVDVEEVLGLFTGKLVFMSQGDDVQYRTPEYFDALSFGITHKLDQSSDDTVGTALSTTYARGDFTGVVSYTFGKGDTENAVGVGASLGIDDLTYTLQFETRDSESIYAGAINYSTGPNNFHLGLMSGRKIVGFEGINQADLFQVYIQALHNVSDNIYFYVEYVDSNAEDSVDLVADVDVETFSVGGAYALQVQDEGVSGTLTD